jgi:hypothetical protein
VNVNVAVAPAMLDCMAVPPLHPKLGLVGVHWPALRLTAASDSSKRPGVLTTGVPPLLVEFRCSAEFALLAEWRRCWCRCSDYRRRHHRRRKPAACEQQDTDPSFQRFMDNRSPHMAGHNV